jgi:hypothetical protein
MPIKYDILNRFTGAVQFTAEIECGADEHPSVKLGLSVKAAIKDGARLDGANLSGASLDRANLSGASLDGARLYGASLDGANLYGANLDGASLDGARLDGANLYGANLDGASLVRARLDGANLYGANLDGAKVEKLIARATRSDGYEFFCWLLDDGRQLVRAGCRTMVITDYRLHVAREYPGTDKALEMFHILDFFQARADATVAQIDKTVESV